jgi:hypothetical protein
MRSLDQGFVWHPATMWYPAPSLSMVAGIALGILVGVLAARAVTIHAGNVSLSAPRLASWGDPRAIQRMALESRKARPAENLTPAIWMPAALIGTSRFDYAFPSAAVLPRETRKQGARSGRGFARRRHVPRNARSARQRRAGKVRMARSSDRRRVAVGKRRRNVVLPAPARRLELARKRRAAKHRRARANRVRPANHRRLHAPAVTQQRRWRQS